MGSGIVQFQNRPEIKLKLMTPNTKFFFQPNNVYMIFDVYLAYMYI